MKAFVFVCLLAAASASPLIHGLGASQYQVHDLLGGYAFGHAGGPSAREEVRTPDGVTRGSYSYVDANGIVQQASYVADPVHGFRVSATNLPTAPVAHIASPWAVSHVAPLVTGHPSVPADTPEVAAAKIAHAQAHAEAHARGKRSPAYYGPPAPLNPDGSVAPTPEIAAETARLHAAHAQEHQRLSQAAALAAAHPDNTSPPESYNSGYQGYNQGQAYNQGPAYNPGPSYNSYNPAASQPAPLNPDGTVAETPEIRAIKASHAAAYQQALQRNAAYAPAPYNGPHYGRRRRSAPLNPDGTVAPTPEVAAATAAHLAAHAGARAVYHPASLSLALSPFSWYSGLPFYARHAPAPLNIDGTVAHTPEYLAVAAAHQAEHIHALHRARRSAPLNPDGTVAPTPEVAAATAAHLAALHGAALGAPAHAYASYAPHTPHWRYTAPAPLNPDGTVAETPEVRAVAAAHYAAHSQQLASLAAQESLAIASGPEDGYYHGEPAVLYHGAPLHRYAEPAPLNPDGTVAHTPEYLAIAASHRAAHYG